MFERSIKPYWFFPHPDLLPEGEGIAVGRSFKSRVMGFIAQALVVNCQKGNRAAKIRPFYGGKVVSC